MWKGIQLLGTKKDYLKFRILCNLQCLLFLIYDFSLFSLIFLFVLVVVPCNSLVVKGGYYSYQFHHKHRGCGTVLSKSINYQKLLFTFHVGLDSYGEICI